ncbi:Na/Pi cotransporter family protein [Bacillus sp. V3B]|uniref:Na/Pi symporter n=1 Tax=Bacillus sp. V3B TaxID=2804915 RepID=UPI0021095C46|nr:Na/Pi symporter [Bacillus sp. V3B]MCQ6276270.1 Na/Pi cotransporter family protein [Bacillus sp. V3B]
MALFVFILLIGVFILGMTLLRSGLFALSGDSLKMWLTKLTDAPWKGLLAGILITCILQSSSAVMIITIGLISARMLSFTQSIGIILGTNIGTTITTELITFDIQAYMIPIMILAIIFLFAGKKKIQSMGLILLGISLVFTAMGGFEHLATPLKEIGFMDQLLSSLNDSYLLSVLTGAVITGIIQSSTATTGIIMGFLTSGAMSVDTGVAIMLGSNIGTCVDAFLASLGGGREARLTAYAHIWLNVLGVAAFYPFIGRLSEVGMQLASSPDVQLAHVSVLFNVLCSLLVLPFANSFGKMVLKIHDKKGT